jgi:hypothetical protein
LSNKVNHFVKKEERVDPETENNFDVAYKKVILFNINI